MSNTVKVIDQVSKSILFETTIENMAAAYTFAEQMEALGLDIEILSPGLAETLIRSLGANESDIQSFTDSLNAEIDEHNEDAYNDSCAICPPPSKSK